MKRRRAVSLCSLLVAAAALAVRAQDIPLPDPQQWKQRALRSMQASERELEKYSCLARDQIDELTAAGGVKRVHSREEEQFFVNGVEIDHTLARDGEQLTGSAARREQQRVDREVRKYSNLEAALSARAKSEKQVDMFLRAVRFSNGRRERRAGRSTIGYVLAPDPGFHPRNIQERFAQALTGSIWLDEQSGSVMELRVETERDVKIGGGLLANVHKGFRFHLQQQQQPGGGVWMTTAIDGSGDLRAGLFLHPHFRFKRRLDKCHLYVVHARESVEEPAEPAHNAARH